MAQPLLHTQSASQGDGSDSHGDEKIPGAQSSPTLEETTGPYRLYKRRWLGVFAMVNIVQHSCSPQGAER